MCLSLCLRKDHLSYYFDRLLWIPELDLGLGIWQDVFDALPQAWLRWCDRNGNFCLTDTEVQEQARATAEQQLKQVEQQLEQTVRRLFDRGMSIEDVAQITGLTEAEIQQRSLRNIL
jgi:DNA-directed RNA polymerase specialized sigma24 family protein